MTINTFTTGKVYGALLTVFALLLMTAANVSAAGTLSPVIDDFNHSDNNNFGIPRQFFNDSMTGGSTTMESFVTDGTIHLKGEIVPARGQLGWASSLLMLDPQGLPRDASQFEGIRLRVKVNRGNLSISANSTEIDNFDYHGAPVAVLNDGQFHEVKIPFTSMKRAWSEQTALNKATINSLSIVNYDFQPSAFDVEVDEVSFY